MNSFDGITRPMSAGDVEFVDDVLRENGEIIPSGITLPFIGVFGFQYPGVDLDELPRLNANMETNVPGTEFVTMANGYQEAQTQQLVAMTHDCPSYLSVVLILLFGMGCIANLIGSVHAALNWKKCRHHFVFVHLFLANIASILFLPFTVAARVAGDWFFNSDMFKALSFVTSLSQTVVAFQLTLLAALRCREFMNNEAYASSNCKKAISYSMWFAALPVATLTFLSEEMLADTIKSASFRLSTETRILYVVSFAFGSLIPITIVVFCIAFSIRKYQAIKTEAKVDYGLLRDMKEIMSLCLLYIVCYIPSQIYRLASPVEINGCWLPFNILVSAVTLFSIFAPAFHVLYVSCPSKRREESRICMDADSVLIVVKEYSNKNVAQDEENAV